MVQITTDGHPIIDPTFDEDEIEELENEIEELEDEKQTLRQLFCNIFLWNLLKKN